MESVYSITSYTARKTWGWTGDNDMKRETNLPDNVVKKSLKLLQSKNLIKEVVNIQNKGRKHYMAAEFELSKEITGGDWYNEGSLDTDFINLAKDACLRYIFRQEVATRDGVLEGIRKSGVFSAEVTTQQIEEILRTLVLDDEIMEVKSTGFGDFSSVPVGRNAKARAALEGNRNLVPWLSFHVEFVHALTFVHQMALSPQEHVTIIKNGWTSKGDKYQFIVLK